MQNHYIIRKIAPFVSLCIKNLEKINNYPLSVQYICLDYPCSTHASAPVQYTRLGLSMGLCFARSHALEPFPLNIWYSSG